VAGQYYVYILTNHGGTVLYIGVTGDLQKRMGEHLSGAGGEFSRRNRLARLLYFEEFGEVDQAIAREKQLNGWRRSKKEALIRTRNPSLLDLRHQL
jgi:putative endonuclease